MARISVLGFTPTESVSPSDSADAIHWSIFVSPEIEGSQGCEQQSPITTRPKVKSLFSSQRRLSKQSSNSSTLDETALFDTHNHQLRQQEFDTSIASFDPELPGRKAASIPSDIPNKPYTLTLKIVLSTHSLPVPKLARRLSSLLYNTPTYGSEEDWLRAALDMLVGASILEPRSSFDADLVLAFAGESVKQYLARVGYDTQAENQVLELDYAKHLREMASVRALFSRDPVASIPAPGQQGPYRPRPTRRSSSLSHFNLRPKSNGTTVSVKTHKFLGFTISPSPVASSSPRQIWNTSGVSGGEKRAYFQRQDDPYGGLM